MPENACCASSRLYVCRNRRSGEALYPGVEQTSNGLFSWREGTSTLLFPAAPRVKPTTAAPASGRRCYPAVAGESLRQNAAHAPRSRTPRLPVFSAMTPSANARPVNRISREEKRNLQDVHRTLDRAPRITTRPGWRGRSSLRAGRRRDQIDDHAGQLPLGTRDRR